MTKSPHPCYGCTKRTSTCHASCPEYVPIDQGRAKRCSELHVYSQADAFMSSSARKARFKRATKAENKKKNMR